MQHLSHLVAFSLDEQRYALALAAVTRVVRAVQITSLPKAPDVVCGVINIEGQIIPVINLRRRFRLPEREIVPSDQFIVARTSMRTVALVVDSTQGVIECPVERFVAAAEIIPGLQYLKGVARLEDGMILIHDLDSFLFIEEAQILDDAIANV